MAGQRFHEGAQPISESPRNTTVLGPDCRITGELALDNDAVIMGRFQGMLKVTGVLEITESAEVSGTIVAGTLRIAGRADANVIAEEGCELQSGAQLTGQIYTTNLNIVDGAVFQGEVYIGADSMQAAEGLTDQVEARKRRGQTEATRRTVHRDDEETIADETDVTTMPSTVNSVLNKRRPAKVLSGNGGLRKLSAARIIKGGDVMDQS